MVTISALRGTLLHSESLVNYTSLRVGGPAKRLYKPADLLDLQQFLRQLPADEPVFWLGLGSNTLIRDGGLNGTVILSLGVLNTLESVDLADTYEVRVGAGVACATLARYCARQGMQGAAFWAGIPGTMGGALRMNAGCHNHETWDFVRSVETINRTGEVQQYPASEYQVTYRSVQGPGAEAFTAANLVFAKGDREAELAEIRTLLKRRADTQPTGEPNCGSVFRNPTNDYAARFIESCGLKGFQMGGAAVSTKHANFIINKNNATARDIENLITHVHAEVKKHHQVDLIREVHIVGDDKPC